MLSVQEKEALGSWGGREGGKSVGIKGLENPS